MPRTLARTPYGVAYEQEDGTVGFFPPDFVGADEAAGGSPGALVGGGQRGPEAPPAGGIVDPFAAQAAPAGTSPPSAGIVDPFVSGGAGGPPQAPGAPPPSAGTEGEGPPSADGGAPASPGGAIAGAARAIGGAVTGAGKAAAGAVGDLAPADKPPAAPPAPRGPTQRELDAAPYEREAQIHEQKVGILDQAAQRDAQIAAQRDAAMGRVARAQAQTAAYWQDRRAAASAAFVNAADELARFERNRPATPFWKTTGQLFAIALGGLGQTLARRDVNQNPALAVLEQRAQAEAAKRAERWQQLRGQVGIKQTEVDHVGDLAKSAEEYMAGQMAAIKNGYAAMIEDSAKWLKDDLAKNEALRLAAVQRQEAAKYADEAAGKRTDREIAAFNAESQAADRLASQRTELMNAQSGRLNAATNRIGALEDIRHNKAMEDKSEIELALRAREADNNEAKLRLEMKAWQDKRAQEGGVMPFVERKVNPDGSTTLTRVEWRPIMNAAQPAVNDLGQPIDEDGRPTAESGKPQAKAPQPWRAPTTEEGKLTRGAIADAGYIASKAYELADIIEKKGWSPDFFRDNNEARQLYGEIMLRRKEHIDKLGVLNGPDASVESQVILGNATGDPTAMARFGNPSGALRSMVGNLEDLIDSQMRSQQYTGDRIKFTVDDAGTVDESGIDADALGKKGGNYSAQDLGGIVGIVNSGGFVVNDDGQMVPADPASMILPPNQRDVVETQLEIVGAPNVSPVAKRRALDQLAVLAEDKHIGDAVTLFLARNSDINFNAPSGSQVPTASTYHPIIQNKLEAWRSLTDEQLRAAGLGPLVERRGGIETVKAKAALGTLGK